jgi:hypothetical protein
VAVISKPFYVDRPTLGQPGYGLLRTANMLSLPVEARGGGIEYETPWCTLPGGYAINCDAGASKTFTTGMTTVTGTPFAVNALATCGSVGMTQDRARDILVSKLRAGEQAAVELIFSRQLFGESPGLSNGGGTAIANPAANANILSAIAVLENALRSTYGPVGMIHVPMLAMPVVLNAHLVEKVNGIWVTAAGTIVTFGNYAGRTVADAAPAAGHTTLYATGAVTIWSTPDSDIFISPFAELIDRTTNQWYGEALREYVMTWECGAFATDVDYTFCC